MLKIAYQLGVEMAVKEAAGETQGLRVLGVDAWKGLKNFFNADKIRSALRDIGAGKPVGVDTSKYQALRKALYPHLLAAGAGGVALGGPPLAKKVFPGLRGD